MWNIKYFFRFGILSTALIVNLSVASFAQEIFFEEDALMNSDLPQCSLMEFNPQNLSHPYRVVCQSNGEEMRFNCQNSDGDQCIPEELDESRLSLISFLPSRYNLNGNIFLRITG